MKEIYKAQYAEAFGIDGTAEDITGYTEPRDSVESWDELVDLQNKPELTPDELRRVKNKLAQRAIEGI